MSNIKFVSGKYVTTINGKTVKRTNLKHLEYVIRKSMVDTPSTVTPTASKFSINDRFGFLSDMVTMLAKGDQASVVVTGPGGLGKSHTVSTSLRKCGLTDLSSLDDFIVGEAAPKNSYTVIKGYSTAKGLYRTLYENRNSVIVFDDCDSVLKDTVSLNLLKGALDSYSRRIISWKADIRDDDLPTVFEFKGRVVFISNMDSHSLDQAILTRSMSVDLSMTTKQKIERMYYLLTQSDFMPDYTAEHKKDAMDLIDTLCDKVKELSLRTLIQVTKIRKSNPNNNWKGLSEYAICG